MLKIIINIYSIWPPLFLMTHFNLPTNLAQASPNFKTTPAPTTANNCSQRNYSQLFTDSHTSLLIILIITM